MAMRGLLTMEGGTDIVRLWQCRFMCAFLSISWYDRPACYIANHAAVRGKRLSCWLPGSCRVSHHACRWDRHQPVFMGVHCPVHWRLVLAFVTGRLITWTCIMHAYLNLLSVAFSHHLAGWIVEGCSVWWINQSIGQDPGDGIFYFIHK